MQLPLPAHLDADAVIACIDPDKDVDGLHVVNAGRLAAGLPGLVPCTPLGCLLLLRDILPSMSGLEAVVVGRSNLVGKPIAQLLLQQNCHRHHGAFPHPQSAGSLPARRYSGGGGGPG